MIFGSFSKVLVKTLQNPSKTLQNPYKMGSGGWFEPFQDQTVQTWILVILGWNRREPLWKEWKRRANRSQSPFLMRTHQKWPKLKNLILGHRDRQTAVLSLQSPSGGFGSAPGANLINLDNPWKKSKKSLFRPSPRKGGLEGFEGGLEGV